MLKHVMVNSIDAINGLKVARFIFRKKPIILMYHRIIDNPLVPGINPIIFEQQLMYLKKHFHIMNMKMFLQAYKSNSVPNNTVVLTFDDGHADFYTTAWPILRRYGLTATLFVTTGFVDQICWLWPDSLRYVLINAKAASIEIDGLGKFDLTPENVLKSWNALGDYCLTLSAADRTLFINHLAIRLNVSIDQYATGPFTSVSWDNLREMQQEGLDIGSHTVTHPILSSLSATELDFELLESKKRITDELHVVPEGICYPNGMARDISALVEQAAELHYQFGLVAYPADISKAHLMRIGRYGSSGNLTDFKLIVSQLTRNNNNSGEYK